MSTKKRGKGYANVGKGGRILGRFRSKKKAAAQERAIHAPKKKGKKR